MKNKYKVYARYNHEQNDWWLSSHRTVRAAWAAADKWTRCHQCDGGKLLAYVYETIDNADCDGINCHAGWTDTDGTHYHSVNYFEAHRVVIAPGGLTGVLR